MSLFFLDQHKSVADIDCLSVNIGSSSRGNPNILVPMSAVAEIILNQEVMSDKRSPIWMFGWIKWRNLDIPLIDFAALQANQPAKDFAGSTRILVLNNPREAHKQPYYAIISQGFPHTLRVAEDATLTVQDSSVTAPCTRINIDFEGQVLQLPDFQQIENHLHEIPSKS